MRPDGHRGRDEWRGRTRARIAVVAIASAAFTLASVPTPSQTEAVWADAEYGASSQFSAPAPIRPAITTCVGNGGILGGFNSFVLYVQMPAGYVPADIQPGFGTTADNIAPLATPPTVEGPTTDGLYTVTYSSTLLGGLLTNLVGSTSYIGVRSNRGGWVSSWRTYRAQIFTLGLGTACNAV